MKRIIKMVVCFTFILNVLNVNAAVVSDNDGSAFVTKAEFEALKTNFANQITSYNSSIDSKIDGAIAAYLASMTTTKVQEYDSELYQVLKENETAGFYNANADTTFSLTPKISYIGNYLIYATFNPIYWRTECYTVYTFQSVINNTDKYVGSTNAKVVRYKTVDSKKIYQGMYNNIDMKFTCNSMKYCNGNDLYYGGVVTAITCANNNFGLIKPMIDYEATTEEAAGATVEFRKNPVLVKCNTKGFGRSTSHSGVSYVSTGYVIPIQNNQQYTDKTTVEGLGTWTVSTHDTTDHFKKNIYENYRFDMTKKEVYNKLPIYHTSAGSTNVYCLDDTLDLDETAAYKTYNVTLKNTMGVSTGGGDWLTAINWMDGATNYTTITNTNTCQLQTLKTTQVKLDTFYNYYVYNKYKVFLKNQDVYWPLVTTPTDREVNMRFTLKPLTTDGTFTIYGNEPNTQTLVPLTFSTTDGTTTNTNVTSAVLTKNKNYTITLGTEKIYNIIVKWVPSTNVAGANKFETSSKVTMSFI